MKNLMVLIVIGGALAGCGPLRLLEKPQTASIETLPRPEGIVRPRIRPGDRLSSTQTILNDVPEQARTVEDFDTTTAIQRAQASTNTDGSRLLGGTVAGLGNPAKPGFWIETPLVSAPSKGRVTADATGKSSQVDLIPIEGAKTAGSRISLAAMRLLGVPLTSLSTLKVYQE